MRRLVSFVLCLAAALAPAGAQTKQQDPEQLLKQGLAAYQKRDYQEALRIWREGLKVAQREQDELFIGSFRGNLAVIYTLLGNFAEAARQFEESIRLAEEAGDRQGLKNRLNNLGGLYLRMRRPKLALERLQKALGIARTLGDKRLEGSILNNIGEACLMLGKPEAAARNLREALGLAMEHHFAETEVNALSNLGRAYEAMGNYPQALSHFRKSISFVQKAKDTSRKNETLVRDYNRLGVLLRELGDPLAAIIAHQSAMELAGKAGLSAQRQESERGIREARAEAGDGSAATLTRLRMEGLKRMIKRLRAHGLERMAAEVDAQLRKLQASSAAAAKGSGR